MLKYSNDDTIALHITKMCNLRCSHCYQNDYADYSQTLNLEEAYKAIDILNPKNIVLYGGEPLIKPDIVKSIMNKYPNKGFLLHTNGIIINREILDSVDLILITLESFLKQRMPQYRQMTDSQYKNMIQTLNNYKNKLTIIHNIYPDGNDELFYKMSRLFGAPVSTYPIVMCTENMEFDESSVQYMPIYMRNGIKVLTKPKLRVLEDGTITRDMRGIYNICKIEDWKEEYMNYELPVHDKCKNCNYFGRCPACNEFPHFCKDVLDKINNPHFCKYTKELHERGFVK
jgi:MoaA/NifB/PqqE/SkfB family radical SAM enzyme